MKNGLKAAGQKENSLKTQIMSQINQYRLLIVDDEADILNAYEKVLSPRSQNDDDSRLEELEKKLFDGAKREQIGPNYDICLCSQGQAAIEEVIKARSDARPFAAAFRDVRMPPGPDGIWTAEQIRKIDPYVHIVIVTAYSDILPEEISRRVQPPERLLYMQKPFHSHEIKQFAGALTAKWQAEKELIDQNETLDRKVKDKTSELRLAVEALEVSNRKYKKINESLQKAEKELEAKAHDLSGANTALQELARQNESDRKELEKKVLFAVHEMVTPYIDNLEKSGLDEVQTSFVNIVRSNLNEITAPFMKELSFRYFRLSPTEISVANLIKQGCTTKEISSKMNITKRNVDFYRDQIREKIGIKNTKANLKNVLKEMEIEFTT